MKGLNKMLQFEIDAVFHEDKDAIVTLTDPHTSQHTSVLLSFDVLEDIANNILTEINQRKGNNMLNEMTLTEIIEEIKTLLNAPQRKWNSDMGPTRLEGILEYDDEGDRQVFLDAGFSLVENYGGEGQGDDYWFVIKAGDRHIKFDGYWASYDGAYIEWEDAKFVEPVEVTVTQWKAVK